jgi:hypothetical protein
MKKAFRDTYQLFLNYPIMLEAFDFELPPFDINGETAIKSFWHLENGNKVPTKNLEEVRRALAGKKSLNLQIKMWAEGMGKEFSILEIKDYIRELNLKEWVFVAVKNQAIKLIRQNPKDVLIELLVENL